MHQFGGEGNHYIVFVDYKENISEIIDIYAYWIIFHV